MVNVHLHEFAAASAVPDAQALAIFETQWTVYQKLVDSDVLSHAAVGRLLHRILAERFDTPFTFLDIACGDAGLARRALAGTRVRHYHGIDLAAPALALAAKTLCDVPYAVDLDHRDYSEAMADRPEPADAVWCGLSIHHLDTDGKQALISEIREVVGDRGIFVLYEPTLGPHEDRRAYLDRTWRIVPDRWTTLTPGELAQVRDHIDRCDLPETAATWLSLGRAAGFSRGRQVFANPTDLYRMFLYEG